jgi:hypothetical protein
MPPEGDWDHSNWPVLLLKSRRASVLLKAEAGRRPGELITGEVFLMTDENVKHTKEYSPKRAAHGTGEYDPFVRGRFPVGVRTIQGFDTVRGRRFPCEIWYPAAAQHAGQDIAPRTRDLFTVPSRAAQRSQMAVRNATAEPGTYPLIIFSHGSGGNRQQSTFLVLT